MGTSYSIFVIMLGEYISSLRNKKGWSRARLVGRMLFEVGDTPVADIINEAFLKRLENGDVVKIPREFINALCKALGCSVREQSRILLLADRNVLHDENGVLNPVIEAVNFATLQLNIDGYDILSDLLQDPHILELKDDDLIELVYEAFEMILKRRKKRK